jgi:adenylate cyclase
MVILGSPLKAEQTTPETPQNAFLSKRRGALASCPLFSDATPQELAHILTLVAEKSVAGGEEIIRQDTQGDCFYILAGGRAEVCRIGDYGEKVTLAFIGPGETVGEMGYFSDGRRTASVYAAEPCDLIRIRYSDLSGIFRASPSLTRNFLDMITDRLKRTNLRFQETAERGRMSEETLGSLSSFLDMSDVAALNLGIDGLIERIVFTASKVMDAERASLFLLDAANGELWSRVAEGEGRKVIRMPVGKGVAGWVALHGEPANIPDAYADERFDRSADLKTGFRTRDILCGPVKNLQGEVVGVIQVINKGAGRYGIREGSLLKAFAYQTAVALENFNLYNRLLNSHHQLAILMELTNAVSQTLNLDTLIIKIVNKTCEILEVERSTLFLLDREKDELWSKVAVGDDMKEIRIPGSAGLAGHVARTGESLNIDDAYRDARFNPSVDRETGFLTRNVLCLPLINRDGLIIGVTEAINKKKGLFTEEDAHLLKALNSQIAVALENAQLYRRTEDMKDYLAGVQDSISNAILTLDDEGRVVMANRSAAALFGLDREDPGKPAFAGLLGPGNDRLMDLLRRVRHDRRALVDYDLDITLSGGESRTVNVNFVPLLDPRENRQGLVLVFENVTLEKQLKGTLTRYMAKDIVERILHDPRRQMLGGVKSKATIRFADIRGFTGMTESLTAEATVEFLNQYFRIMVDVIFANNGVLDKYIGDGIMAVFGVPYPEPDDAVRAVRTALQMHSALSRINAGRTAAGQEPIRIGIGICTGDVVSGNIGSEKRMEYTVIGNEVNAASRLENLCAHYGVHLLIGESTLGDLQDRFTVRPVDFVLITGKKKPVRIFEVLCEGRRPMTQAEECFGRGLDLYRQKAFAPAAREFSAGLSGDPLCGVFLDRCRSFLSAPPPPNWDGAWMIDKKK